MSIERSLKILFVVASAIIIFLFAFIKITNSVSFRPLLSSVFFIDSTSTAELKRNYETPEKKIKILIVPGHDSGSFGTNFGKLKEADLTLLLGEDLFDYLKRENKFEVFIARDKRGFMPEILNYIKRNRSQIENFVSQKKEAMNELIRNGDISDVEGVIHNQVSFNTAINLYGMNKWANENGIDLVLHIHFNDYPGRKAKSAGKYSGFSIYIPEPQYSNAKASKELAEYIFDKLNKFYPKSDLPKESAGIVPDQKLIAVGSYNTLDGIGLLAEYGYIYEPQFQKESVRIAVVKDMAFQTYLGIIDFFDKKKFGSEYFKSYLLPHTWSSAPQKNEFSASVLSLQAALVLEGVYPPEEFKRNDCPMSGRYKSCVSTAVKAFQKKYGLEPTGDIGPRTLKKLNELYSTKIGD